MGEQQSIIFIRRDGAKSQQSMSKQTQIAAATFSAILIAAGIYFWLHSDYHRHPLASAAHPSADFVVQPAAAPAETLPQPALATNSSATPVEKKNADPGASLRAGEVLDYSANVSKLNDVATLRLFIAGRGALAGKPSWHLQAMAHTQNPLRMVFELDDQFDSYSDAATLASLQYEMHLNERGQKVESIQRMSSSGREPAPANAAIAHVLPGTRDPLGMMQYLRNVDWAKTPQVRSPVYDGRKLYDVSASLAAKSEPVSVPAGKYTASKIEVHVFDNGVELKDAHFKLYLDNQPGHVPVLLEAVLPFAVATVELQSAK
jgi:hypothetical protein